MVTCEPSASVVFTALAFLVRPTAIFYLLPVIFVYRQYEGRWWPIPKRYWWWVVAAFLPFILWRIWILQHPEGIPPSAWLLNGDGIRFKPIFWKWIIGERIGKEILTVAGSCLFFLGLVTKSKNNILHYLALSLFLYLIIFATGNVRHDYYQVLIVPMLVAFTARGFVILLRGENLITKIGHFLWLFYFYSSPSIWAGMRSGDFIRLIISSLLRREGMRIKFYLKKLKSLPLTAGIQLFFIKLIVQVGRLCRMPPGIWWKILGLPITFP